MQNNANQYVLGIDLGGTKIYSAVVDQKGTILATARKKTKAKNGFKATIQRMVDCANLAVENSEIGWENIIAIGVGSPGPLDLKNGKIIETPNLKWKDAPLKEELEKALKKPVKIDNDGNVGILGEFAYGAGQGAQHMVGLFIGTGIGGGVIIDGNLLHGFNENAGELGHMILDPEGPRCGCGNKGCVEAFASRLSIEREIRDAQSNGIKTGVFKDMKDHNKHLRSRRLAEFYAQKDPAVTLAIDKSAKYVGIAVASLLNIFNPEVVVLGGGVVEALGDTYVKMVQETAAKNVFKIALRNVRITAATLKDDSAVLGAAVLGWQIVNEPAPE